LLDRSRRGMSGASAFARMPARPRSRTTAAGRPMAKIAILDDYQNVALGMADWSRLKREHQLEVFHRHRPGPDAAARALADFPVPGIRRERTPFPRALFERLPNLKLLVTTGRRNASVDLAAAKDHGVTVCATGGAGRSTAELAFALMLA